jgi:hypothetical protein
VHCDTTDVLAANFDLSGVEAGAHGKPDLLCGGPNASAQRTARPGPSNVATMPSPVHKAEGVRCLHRSALKRTFSTQSVRSGYAAHPASLSGPAPRADATAINSSLRRLLWNWTICRERIG